MKRQSAGMESLVYAYGCGQPIIGWQEAQAESERMSILWDKLVDIERMAEAETLAAARGDELEIDRAVIALGAARIALKADYGNTALRADRSARQRELWALLGVWRKAHAETLNAIEQARRARVVTARQQTDCWWPNYNAVIQNYDTARIEVKKKGRNLRHTDLARDDGFLAVQLQRTKSGLGALPLELQNGMVNMLAIGRVDPSANDPATFRGERRRLCQTVVEMRVDSAGNMIRLPIWMHRQLPDDCRVKGAQLTWYRRGERYRYQLCLTISRPAREVLSDATGQALVTIDIGMAGRDLQVGTISGNGQPESIILDRDWTRQMDRLEHLQSVIADDEADTRLRIQARMQSPGLRSRLLNRRREQYRLLARRLAMSNRKITIQTPPLSEAAWLDQGTDRNSLRQRACAHSLLAEIQHQGKKHGCQVEILAVRDASAKVPRRVRNRTIKDLAQRDLLKNGPLANVPANP